MWSAKSLEIMLYLLQLLFSKRFAHLCIFCFPPEERWKTGGPTGLGKNKHACAYMCTNVGNVQFGFITFATWLWYACTKKNAGIWNWLAACEYYFSIHAHMHKIKYFHFARQWLDDHSKVSGISPLISCPSSP